MYILNGSSGSPNLLLSRRSISSCFASWASRHLLSNHSWTFCWAEGW